MKTQTVQIDHKLQALFDQMPGCWGCKDKDSVFMYANKEYAKIIGVKESKHLDIIGKTDFDKHELIDKAIQAGFLNSIPEGLFNTQLSMALKED